MSMWKKASLGVLLLSVAALVGCDSGSGGSSDDDDDKPKSSAEKGDDEGPRKKLEIEWPKDNKFTVKGNAKQYGDCTVFRGTYQVTIHGFPKGTQWSAGDKKGTTQSPTLAILKLKDVQTELGKLKIADLIKVTVDPKLTLKLQPPGYEAEIKLPPGRVLGLNDILKKVENGPVLFGEESEEAKKGLAILSLESLRPKVFGKATLLEEVDAIAVSHLLEEVKGTKTCKGYTDNAGKPMPDIELQLKETEVAIYNRRTGDEIAKKVFPPDNSCPQFTFQRKDEKSKDSSKPTRTIEAWLRSQAKR
ncbi:MAG: hypothetical protein JRI68_25960 [Deltaproteobacteria bacterium]|nr:hypothetical protein [Deltaproteobacteria bacterium]